MRFLLLFLVTSLLFNCTAQLEINDDDTIIKNVAVLSIHSAESQIQDVVIRKEKIHHIGRVQKTKNGQIIDGSGKFLIPGLTEMHAHIPVAENGNDTLVRETLFLYLSQGVTTIRGMLGHPYHLELKQLVAKGEILSPRIYTSSPSLNGSSIPTKEDAIQKITQYQKDGYDFLKIHPGISLDVWESVESTANEVGISFSGHVPLDVGIHRALDAQYATIDHMDGFIEGLVPAHKNLELNSNGFFGYHCTPDLDLSLISELVEKTIRQNVAIVPTQTLFTRWFSPEDPSKMLLAPEMKYMPSKTRFSWRQNKERLIGDESYNTPQWRSFIDARIAILKEMDKQGVQFLLGSDAPQVMNVPGFSIHHEMKAMTEAGISNQKILLSGTSQPAAFFNASEKYGEIKQGLSADFVLLNANPFDDIANAQKIEGVMVRGHWLSAKKINDRLREIEIRNQ